MSRYIRVTHDPPQNNRTSRSGRAQFNEARSQCQHIERLLIVLALPRRSGHYALVDNKVERLVTVVLTVSDLDRAVRLFVDGFGLDLHIGDHEGDDLWTSGRHAATSWTDGAFMHFALYETKDGATTTTGALVAFRVSDLAAAHLRAVTAGAEVLHGPKAQPWGQSARYLDQDGNVVELTQND